MKTKLRHSILVAFCLFLFCSFNPKFALGQIPIEVGKSYNFGQAAPSTVRYKIILPMPGEFTISISNWLSTYDWGMDYDRLYIYNEALEPIGIGPFGNSTDNFLFHMFQGTDGLVFRVGAAGTYYIDIHSGQPRDWGNTIAQSYSLSVTALYCNDQNEPNDDLSTATAITLGQKVSGLQWRRVPTNAVSGDEDWYKIQLDSPGELSIQLINWIGVYNWGTDFDRFYIYNEAGESIGPKTDDSYYAHMMGGGTELEPVVVKMNLAKGGIYYLHFHAGAATNTSQYSFSTSFVPVIDLFEPNDALLNAKPILLDTKYQANQWRSLDQTMSITDDEDWYSLRLNSPGELSVHLVNWEGVYNWGTNFDRFYIYDENGESVGPKTDDPYYSQMMGGGTESAPVTIKMNLSQGGLYYLRFHAGVAAKIPSYNLSTSFIPVNDTFEPNDELSTAKTIDFDVTYQAYEWRSTGRSMTVVGDEDYYLFNATQVGEYSLEISGWLGIYNWGADYDRIWILDEKGLVVGADPLGWMIGNPASIKFAIPSPGKYYICLHCGGIYSTTNYTFKLIAPEKTGVDEIGTKLNLTHYPNPFSSSTKIQFELTQESFVDLKIFNSLGQEVKTILCENVAAGSHSLIWNAENLPSGDYFLRLQADKLVQTRKVVLLKK